MYAIRAVLATIMAATMVTALPGYSPNNGSPEHTNAPNCGGDQAVCCTGSYTAEGELVDNCITYTSSNSVCSTDSNVYCCYTCTEAAGSCVGCSHFY